jgi:hypothetical protein
MVSFQYMPSELQLEDLLTKSPRPIPELIIVFFFPNSVLSIYHEFEGVLVYMYTCIFYTLGFSLYFCPWDPMEFKLVIPNTTIKSFLSKLGWTREEHLALLARSSPTTIVATSQVRDVRTEST